MTREDFLETFIDTIRELRPQYAIPFASMVAFLHPESRQCNAYAVRPPEVAAAMAGSDVAATTKTVLMVPGDGWSSESGFALQRNDYYERQNEWIDRLAQQAEPKIRQEEADERGIALTFEAFEKHFGGFLRSLPPFIWLVLKRPMVFFVASDPLPYWVLDFRTRAVRRPRGAAVGSRRDRPDRRRRFSPTRLPRTSSPSSTSRCACASTSRPAACRPISCSGACSRCASSVTSRCTAC